MLSYVSMDPQSKKTDKQTISAEASSLATSTAQSASPPNNRPGQRPHKTPWTSRFFRGRGPSTTGMVNTSTQAGSGKVNMGRGAASDDPPAYDVIDITRPEKPVRILIGPIDASNVRCHCGRRNDTTRIEAGLPEGTVRCTCGYLVDSTGCARRW